MTIRDILLISVASVGLLMLPPVFSGPGGLAGFAWADDDGGDGDGGDGGDSDGGDDGGDNDGDDAEGADDDDGDDGDSDDDDGPDNDFSRDDDDDDDDSARQSRGRTGGDGGDDNGDDDREERRAGSLRTASPPPTPRLLAARDEIVTLALSDADLAALQAQGYDVIEEYRIGAVDETARRLAVPRGTTLEQARDAVRALDTGVDADLNHYYRTNTGFPEDCSGLECPARTKFGWTLPENRQGSCGGDITVGMVDTGINIDHPTFRDADLVIEKLSDSTPPKEGLQHGTAIASLLVGAPGTRSPGLVPGAKLVAVDAFHQRHGDERADVFSLIEALDLLVADGVQVINLSLAGPRNTALEEFVSYLVNERDIVLVAAAGNAGPRSDPLYPAAFEDVIAVTAIDREHRVYRRAVQGEHIDLAAPGVAIWAAASVDGARWQTGTSFAVPFVSAAAAMLRDARPELTATEIRETLTETAEDLGEAGTDPVYGAGLVSPENPCIAARQDISRKTAGDGPADSVAPHPDVMQR